jgi:hypothetical protein
VVVLLISLFMVSMVSWGGPASDRANDEAREKAKAPALEKIEFIHWRRDFAKPPCNNNGVCEPQKGENPSCGDCKTEVEEPAPTAECYAFIGKYGKKLLKWRALPVEYVINPELSSQGNPEGLDESLITGAIAAGAGEWDYYAGPELFSNSWTVSSDVEYGVNDGKNAVSFGDYPTPGVIAVTSVWYNPATKAIVEFDIMFDTDWVWGDAEATPDVMDLRNIATHELGHAVGLGDVYEAECSEATMYGYSDYGETIKRDIEGPDVIGITTLYE